MKVGNWNIEKQIDIFIHLWYFKPLGVINTFNDFQYKF